MFVSSVSSYTEASMFTNQVPPVPPVPPVNASPLTVQAPVIPEKPNLVEQSDKRWHIFAIVFFILVISISIWMGFTLLSTTI